MTKAQMLKTWATDSPAPPVATNTAAVTIAPYNRLPGCAPASLAPRPGRGLASSTIDRLAVGGAAPSHPPCGSWSRGGWIGDMTAAGHCTYGVGRNGTPTTAPPTNGSGGKDVWINFREAPNFDILPPSSSFASNAARYAAWSAALNASPQWHRATAFPHPQFDPAAFFTHDAGVLRLSAPVPMSTYGTLPAVGLLNTLIKQKRTVHYTPVG